jgi:guanosine-3',5'-bis(diphosphate) 3'-pyrophosphohydrolase
VSGVDDLMVYRAKCCNPIRGEAIVGYITRGKGVAVHSKACPNVQNLLYQAERKIDVAWEGSASAALPVKLVIHTDDQPGLLNQLTAILFSENANIRSLEAKTEIEATSDALIEMTIDVKDKKQLEKLVSAMRRISGIRDVERLFQ